MYLSLSILVHVPCYMNVHVFHPPHDSIRDHTSQCVEAKVVLSHPICRVCISQRQPHQLCWVAVHCTHGMHCMCCVLMYMTTSIAVCCHCHVDMCIYMAHLTYKCFDKTITVVDFSFRSLFKGNGAGQGLRTSSILVTVPANT